jgi:hypothetical protein
MHALRALVKGGRLLLDEPTDLPDGEVVVLVRADEDDNMSVEERARLDAAIELGLSDARAGRLVDGDGVLHRLLARA